MKLFRLLLPLFLPILALPGCGHDDHVTTSSAADAGADLAITPDLVMSESPMRPPWPTLPSGDGRVLSPMKLVTIVADNDGFAADLLAFGDALVQSKWWKAMAADYGIAPAATNLNVTGPTMSRQMTGAQVEMYIQQLIMNKKAPAPDGNTMYMVYLADGVILVDDNTGMPNTDCNLYEGYHTQFAGGVDNWAVAQRCFGATAKGLDDITNTGSHEIIESATDPTGAGWTFDQPSQMPWTQDIWVVGSSGGEGADACAGSSWLEGRFNYARSWSTMAARGTGDPCVPALAEPYWIVYAPKGWYPVPAGQTVTIPLVGFATGTVGDFTAEPQVIDYSQAPDEFAFAVKGAKHATVNGMDATTLNRGETVELSVSVPKSAASGDWVVYWVTSALVNRGMSPDDYHLWPVGVYVP